MGLDTRVLRCLETQERGETGGVVDQADWFWMMEGHDSRDLVAGQELGLGTERHVAGLGSGVVSSGWRGGQNSESV